MSDTSKPNAKIVAKYYWERVKKYPYSLAGILFVMPLNVLLGQTLPPLIFANVLRKLSNGDYIKNQPWQSFHHEIILYGSIILVTGFILWRLVDIFVWRLESNIQRDISMDVFNHLSGESADFHANHFSGSLVSQTNQLKSSYVRVADTTFYSTLQLFSGLILAAIVMWSKSRLFVGFLILFSTIYIAVAFYASEDVRTGGAKHSEAESKQTGYLADMIGNVMAVKSFGGEAQENDAFDKKTRNTQRNFGYLMKAHMRQMYYFSGVSRTISILALVIAIVSVVNNGADIATTFLVLAYTTTLVDQLFQFSNNSLRNYNRSIGDAFAMVKILNEEAEIKDPASPEKVYMNRGAIRFNDVVFKHTGAHNPIFSGLDLRIKPGEKVGLVGHSGSGKTSLTRILLRFSDIQEGTIEIDGQNISSVTQADLRRSISYVPQEPILFHRTIAENIAYGRPEASRQEIEVIARKANADDFIKTLQHGYETVVGERGVKLSGGQRQRIAIARAMLKNAPILVLDEATSALDSESESLIQDALWKLMEGRTAIVIAHRLSTIQKMDRIIVLDNGAIVEEGSHKDLLYKNGVYAKLWNHQSGGFIEDQND